MKNSFIFHVIVIFFAFLSVEKVSGQVPRLIGGEVAPSKYGKFQASLQDVNNRHICGGSIVSKWLVVTAAHCVHVANPDYVKIVTGTNNLREDRIRYDVSEIICHHDYDNSTRRNDIALIISKEPFDMHYASAIKMEEQPLVEGDNVLLTGFGSEEPNGDPRDCLHFLNITVFDQEVCEYAMRYNTPVTEKMFCTFSKIGEGTCHGDSGSPVIKDNKLVGVVSWGIPCAVGFPDVHTRISPYVGWIEKHMRRTYCKEHLSPVSMYGQLQYLAKHLAHVTPEHIEFLKLSSYQ